MGVSPVQFPKSHLVVFCPLRIKPSLHWYKPVPPCRVFGTYNCTSMMMTADQDRHITERLLRLPTTSNWMNVLLLRLIDTHTSIQQKLHYIYLPQPFHYWVELKEWINFFLSHLFLKKKKNIDILAWLKYYLAGFCNELRRKVEIQ